MGNTGILVSRLCFGSLTIGPLQANLPLEQGAKIIRYALESGVNFIDTAQLYATYPYIRKAIEGIKNEVVIATKSYAYTANDMRGSLEEALRSISRDYIDIFLLHEQESILTMKGHWEAVEYLVKAKNAGLVRAIGISTHSVEAVKAAFLIPEFEIIHPLINMSGIGIKDGTREEMLTSIQEAAWYGKGLYGMKALGGGNLLDQVDQALGFVISIPQLASIAVGMSSAWEVDFNMSFFSGREISKEMRKRAVRQKRRLLIESWCTGCGKCINKCDLGAIKLIGNRPVVNQELCRLCGYCGAACPDLCIRVV